jgi:hypothetical protein
LPVADERIDVAPEHLQQAIVADTGRDEHDAHGFRMPCAARRNPVVRGVGYRARRAAAGRREDPIDLAIGRFHTPEATAGEGAGVGRDHSHGGRRDRLRATITVVGATTDESK